jgi:hypothetical protein
MEPLPVYFVDNVITTGNTIRAARAVLGWGPAWPAPMPAVRLTTDSARLPSQNRQAYAWHKRRK